MKSIPPLPHPIPPSGALEAATRAAAEYARASRAAATRRAYDSDWQIFSAWCAAVGACALPASPATLAAFLAAEGQRGRAPNTLGRRRAAIRLKHREAQLPSPHDAVEVEAVLRGIRRAWQQPPNRKAPAVDTEVQQLVDTLPANTLAGLRDRALLLVGFAGAFRRSELVALDVAHLTPVPQGLLVRIARSKTDQECQGQTVAIARVSPSRYCPVQALLDWRAAAGIERGPLFLRIRRGDRLTASRLTDKSVARIIKRCCLSAGLNPALYAGHSLRRGFLTSAARAKANIFKMAQQSRHKSLDVLRAYVEDAERFQDHAAEGLLCAPGEDPAL